MKKKLLTISAIVALGVTLIFSSCEMWIDTDMNIDPDVPTEVPIGLILPSIQANMAYDLGGNDMAVTPNVWLQTITGYARQMNIIANYVFAPSDINNVWNSCYYVTMMDCKVLIEKALEQEAYHFAGVGQISLAYTLAQMTDVFGDIPYTEAFQGMEVLEPNVDSQESIYAVVDQLLTDAIANLTNADNALVLSNDMIHGNSAAAWVKTANALKARYALNLSERNSGAYAEALSYLASAYTSNDDNFAFAFGATSSSWGPIAQFMDDRNDLVMAKYFVDMLDADGDPRLPFYAEDDGSGGYTGLPAGEDDNTDISRLGTYLAGKTAGVYTSFMTYHELKFIEAEALLPTDGAGALAAYQAGVIASLEWVGVDLTATTFDDDILALGSITLEEIIRQKYIANYGQAQIYNDWRRTNYPDVAGMDTPPTATKEIPRRFPYPQGEITYNSKIEALWQKTVFLETPVWWDAN